MKKLFCMFILISIINSLQGLPPYRELENPTPSYEWAVIGAGFAGITALAVLLDAGVDQSSVVWIDPEFNVGRVGKYYREVPGNIQIKHLIEYIQSCPFFKEITSVSLDKLYMYDREEFKQLQVIIDPMIDFTAYLQKKIVPIKTTINELTRADDHWLLKASDYSVIHARKVILAIGAHPKRLDLDLPEICLDEAFNKNRLKQMVSYDDCIAVFGGMHSAMLVLKYLCECCVKQVINFYRRDYFHGSPGLEGLTSMWAEDILEKNPPANLIRVINSEENREAWLPLCTKAIYAMGYESNSVIINGSADIPFDEYTGIIDENVYGIGIAFPPTGVFNGQKIAKNGLSAYLAYAKKLIPRWVSGDKGRVTEEDCVEIPWI
jgi:thioredoxin reductase